MRVLNDQFLHQAEILPFRFTSIQHMETIAQFVASVASNCDETYCIAYDRAMKAFRNNPGHSVPTQEVKQ